MRNLVIFNRDLRLSDNLALFNACKSGDILPVFIYNEANYGKASKVWLHHSLISFQKSLENNLAIISGNLEEEINKIVKEYKIDKIFMNSYEQVKISTSAEIHTYNTNFLFSYEDILKKDNSPYKIFTPFYKKSLILLDKCRKPLDAPKEINFIKHNLNKSIEELKLLPTLNWHKTIMDSWNPGEHSAQAKLNNFINNDLKHYGDNRDFLGEYCVSKLSPHINFGEISPIQILHQVRDNSCDFIRELIWREFDYYTYHYNPHIINENLNNTLNNYKWNPDKKMLKLWKEGKTGYPIIDAAMNELTNTGYMHGRTRMIVASFLIKNMGIDWREGASHFRDFLLDADDAINSFSWQWSAGSGFDCNPYFRVFNPVTQMNKFDKNRDYIKRNLIIDDCYPNEIVDLSKSRDDFIKAVKDTK
ncbi:MAG: DNA photolyase family protein [Alphaproteobacteria bacterium]|nr:DNA photolyase family protein [Alphaproteobacteria bacterium]